MTIFCTDIQADPVTRSNWAKYITYYTHILLSYGGFILMGVVIIPNFCFFSRLVLGERGDPLLTHLIPLPLDHPKNIYYLE